MRANKKQWLDALNQSHGSEIGAAEIVGVKDDTATKYCNRWPESRQVIAHWKKRRTHRALYKLDEAIEKGEPWAVKLQLSGSKDGQMEGYSDRVDLTSDGEKIQPIGLIPIDYRTGLDSLMPKSEENDRIATPDTAPGSIPDSDAPGEDQNPGDGSPVG